MSEPQELIYLVTAGEYSDYHIVGVFTTKELAQQFIEKCRARKHNYAYSPQIETYYLNPTRFMRRGVKNYFITMGEDGTTIKASEYAPRYASPVTGPDDFELSISEQKLPSGAIRYILRDVWARSEKHAVKIASDALRAYKANTPFQTDQSILEEGHE